MFWNLPQGSPGADCERGQIFDMAINAFIPSVVLHISSLCRPSTSVMLDARSCFILHHVVHMNFYLQEEIGQTNL